MFPHMYKVRPGKIQQVREPGMATDCQRQRGENWRRNSGGSSSFQQSPPAIPAPPPDPQDNLQRKPSLTSKEPERKGSQGHSEFIENVSLANRNSPPDSSRTRIRARGIPDANCENVETQEITYTPPRRSRTRQSDGQIANNENGETGYSDRSRMRTRSRSRVSEDKSFPEISPSSSTDTSTSSTIRLRSRSRRDEEPKNSFPVVENSYPPPLRSRSRSKQSEELHNDMNHSVEEESASFSPRLRTRSRTGSNDLQQNEISKNVTNEDKIAEDSQRSHVRMRSRSRPSEDIQKDISTIENNYPINIRTRSRSRTNRVEEDQTPVERSQSPKIVNKPQSLPPAGRQLREQVNSSDNNCEAPGTLPLRSRSRNRSTELNNQNNANIEISETIPIRSRSRNRSTLNNDNEGNSEDSQVETVRSRSRSTNNEIAGKRSDETLAKDNQVVSPPVQTVTIRLRKRPKKQEPEESSTISQETINDNISLSQLPNNVSDQKSQNEEKPDEETATVTIRRRRPGLQKQEEIVSMDSNEEEKASGNQNLSSESEKTFSQEEVKENLPTEKPSTSPSEKKESSSTRFFPETQKSEFIIRKRSLSPVPPSTKKNSSPVTRRRRLEESRQSPPPSLSKAHDESSPIIRRRSQPSSVVENEQMFSQGNKQEHPMLEEDLNESPIEPMTNKSLKVKSEVIPESSEMPTKGIFIINSSPNDKVDESPQIKSDAVPRIIPERDVNLEKDKPNEMETDPMILTKEEDAKEQLKSRKEILAIGKEKDFVESAKDKGETEFQITTEVSSQMETELPLNAIKSNSFTNDENSELRIDEIENQIIRNDAQSNLALSESEYKNKSEQVESELLSNEMQNDDKSRQEESNLTPNERQNGSKSSQEEANLPSSEMQNENRSNKTESELPSNILTINIKEDDWEKQVIKEKSEAAEKDLDTSQGIPEPENRRTLTSDLVTDSSENRKDDTKEKWTESYHRPYLAHSSNIDKQEENSLNNEEETQEKENEEEKEKIESSEETDEDQEEDEDPLATATRLWLMSKNQDSEILEKVLPEIESTSAIKNRKSEERDIELLDPDLETDKSKEVKPQIIEEWNEEFKEEPKNFTSFTSIKLKSRPPKSPPQKKSGKQLSKDGGSQIPSAPPPPPPPPPGPPKSKSGVPPPPPPPMSEKDLKVKKAREKMVDKIKRAARSRPDWKSVMKDIEGGIKLRKVSSSDKLDRSNPILPRSRGKGGKFFYESEKPVVQNQLLGEIQRGVKLRHVKTNDRSKPDFAKLGLRKLRRQLTVEEKKSLPANAPEALPSSSDEEEDIDQMRDDLASTKTQLAEEIKKNKKLETEQKILQIDLQSLQAEVKKLKRKLKEAGVHEAKPLTNGEAEALAPKLSKSMSKLRMMEDELDFAELDTIEKDIQLLNDQIEAQKKRAEKAELKCEELNQKLQVSQASCDEWEMRSVYFEKKHKALQKDQGIELPEIDCSGTQTDPIEIGPAKSDSSTGLYTKKSSSRKSFASVSRMQSLNEEDESDDESSSSSEEDTLSDHQDDEDEERDSEEFEDDLKGSFADLEKREEREFITWKNRLTHMKDKVKNVRKERNNLRERVKKFYADMRNERKEYLKLKDELKELLDQMKDDEETIEDGEEDEEDSEEDEEELAQEDESPDWWHDEAPQKPKKLKKRKKKEKENEDEDENIVDMSGLEDPQWSESEQEESESEEEDENTANRIKSLKEKTKNLEENMNAKRKETYLLKSRIDQCDEMFAEEKRRHARLENELHMLLADI